MNALVDEGRRPQGLYAGLLALSIGWQIYVALRGMSHAATLRALGLSMGMEFPLLTRWYLASVPFWIAVPVVLAATGWVLLRSKRYGAVAAVIITSLAAGFVMQAWVVEAWTLPFMHLIKSVAAV
jgi:hypothetical protein